MSTGASCNNLYTASSPDLIASTKQTIKALSYSFNNNNNNALDASNPTSIATTTATAMAHPLPRTPRQLTDDINMAAEGAREESDHAPSSTLVPPSPRGDLSDGDLDREFEKQLKEFREIERLAAAKEQEVQALKKRKMEMLAHMERKRRRCSASGTADTSSVSSTSSSIPDLGDGGHLGLKDAQDRRGNPGWEMKQKNNQRQRSDRSPSPPVTTHHNTVVQSAHQAPKNCNPLLDDDLDPGHTAKGPVPSLWRRTPINEPPTPRARHTPHGTPQLAHCQPPFQPAGSLIIPATSQADSDHDTHVGNNKVQVITSGTVPSRVPALTRDVPESVADVDMVSPAARGAVTPVETLSLPSKPDPGVTGHHAVAESDKDVIDLTHDMLPRQQQLIVPSGGQAYVRTIDNDVESSIQSELSAAVARAHKTTDGPTELHQRMSNGSLAKGREGRTVEIHQQFLVRQLVQNHYAPQPRPQDDQTLVLRNPMEDTPTAHWSSHAQKCKPKT
nr:hypothetical protein BaRGS_015558 [Batillaria attramentaria]